MNEIYELLLTMFVGIFVWELGKLFVRGIYLMLEENEGEQKK